MTRRSTAITDVQPIEFRHILRTEVDPSYTSTSVKITFFQHHLFVQRPAKGKTARNVTCPTCHNAVLFTVFSVGSTRLRRWLGWLGALASGALTVAAVQLWFALARDHAVLAYVLMAVAVLALIATFWVAVYSWNEVGVSTRPDYRSPHAFVGITRKGANE